MALQDLQHWFLMAGKAISEVAVVFQMVYIAMLLLAAVVAARANPTWRVFVTHRPAGSLLVLVSSSCV